jgi:hypothetical protein
VAAVAVMLTMLILGFGQIQVVAVVAVVVPPYLC